MTITLRSKRTDLCYQTDVSFFTSPNTGPSPALAKTTKPTPKVARSKPESSQPTAPDNLVALGRNQSSPTKKPPAARPVPIQEPATVPVPPTPAVVNGSDGVIVGKKRAAESAPVAPPPPLVRAEAQQRPPQPQPRPGGAPPPKPRPLPTKKPKGPPNLFLPSKVRTRLRLL